MKFDFHKLLLRQLSKLGIDPKLIPIDFNLWWSFLERISNTYKDHDRDRYLLERSLEISSQEMMERYEDLNHIKNFMNEAERLSKMGGWRFKVETGDLWWSDETYIIHEVPIGEKLDVSKAIEFYAEKDRPIIKNAVERAIVNGDPYDLELKIVTAKGNEVWVRTLGALRIDKNNEKVLAGTFQDISDFKKIEREKKELNQQLLQASKMSSLGIMASGVAHELNNPLTVVMNYGHNVLKNMDKNDANYEKVERMVKASNRMEKIINHLRVFSRDTAKEKFRPISIKNAISEALILQSGMFRNENISFIFNKEKLVNDLIFGNSVQIESVFQNLFTNSRQAFANINDGREKRILVILENRNGTISIEYSDNAGGMSDEVMDNLFVPFFTTKDVGEGTGIGMSISLGIIHDHEGTIDVESHYGAGTTFKICIKNCSAKSSPLNKEKKEVIEKSSTEAKKQILLIDDEEDVLAALELILSDMFDVVSTTSPEEGLKLLGNRNFHMLITDLRMPKMSGIELIERVSGKWPNLPIVAITGNIKVSEKENRILQNNTEMVLFKPLRDLISFLDKLNEIG